MPSPLKILFVSSEIVPFAKTGGLADVSAALPRALSRAGHDLRVVMPLYGTIDRSQHDFAPHPRLQDVPVEFGERSFRVSVLTAKLPGSEQAVWFLDCPELYGRHEIYGDGPDEHLRFALLSKAPLVLCQHLGWAPDIVHLNDWHTGLTPLYKEARFDWDQLFKHAKTVLTIHNIGYQGVFPAGVTSELGFADDSHLFHREQLADGIVNFLATGVLYADALTTVSRTYALEIQTEELGAGLQDLLRARADKLFGIVNGVDHGVWDPAVDPLLVKNYGPGDLDGKRVNKRWLLEEFRLDADLDAPTLGIVSRMTPQKGHDLFGEILPVLVREANLRLVVIGEGEERYVRFFQWLRDAFPDKVGFYQGYSEELAHRIEAGCDLFLMPSRYEPCGLNQMYSLKYGTVPVVRRTGGLADTVEDYDPVTGDGTGFVFVDFTPEALLEALRRALRAYADGYTWRRIVEAGMAKDFSWERQAEHYVTLYRNLTGRSS